MRCAAKCGTTVDWEGRQLKTKLQKAVRNLEKFIHDQGVEDRSERLIREIWDRFLNIQVLPSLTPSLTYSVPHSLTHSNLRASLIVVVCVQAMASAAGQELYHASLPVAVMSVIPFPIIHTREVEAGSSWAPLRLGCTVSSLK